MRHWMTRLTKSSVPAVALPMCCEQILATTPRSGRSCAVRSNRAIALLVRRAYKFPGGSPSPAAAASSRVEGVPAPLAPSMVHSFKRTSKPFLTPCRTAPSSMTRRRQLRSEKLALISYLPFSSLANHSKSSTRLLQKKSFT